MTDQELKKWFLDKFNSCYQIKNDDCVDMYYDENFIRKYKFKVLQGKEIVYPEKPYARGFFHQDYKNEILWCDYKYIWSFLESNSNYNYNQICRLITDWLCEDIKLKVLTPTCLKMSDVYYLYDDKIIKDKKYV